jgi:hypothetical protein
MLCVCTPISASAVTDRLASTYDFSSGGRSNTVNTILLQLKTLEFVVTCMPQLRVAGASLCSKTLCSKQWDDQYSIQKALTPIRKRAVGY